MKVIVLASAKGGVSKTTLSGHLACEAERVGAGPVALMDTDNQQSLAAWWSSRKADDLKLVDPLVDLDELRQSGIKLLIVDTPPTISARVMETIRAADLILIPTRPSSHDLRVIGSTVELVEGADKPMAFVLTQANQRARVTNEVIRELSQHGTVAPVTMHMRTDYATSMFDGRTVQEVDPSGKSASEIADLWQYVSKRLALMETKKTKKKLVSA